MMLATSSFVLSTLVTRCLLLFGGNRQYILTFSDDENLYAPEDFAQVLVNAEIGKVKWKEPSYRFRDFSGLSPGRADD